MKAGDYSRKSNSKPRVSFSVPIMSVTDNNTAPKGGALRLARPKFQPIFSKQKQTTNCIAGNMNSGETQQTKAKKSGLRNNALFPKRSCGVQKYFVRDSELPVSQSTQSNYSARNVGGQGILKNKLLIKSDVSTECRCNETSCQSETKNYRPECDSPELLSSLSIAKKIQFTTAALREPKSNIYSLNPLVEQGIEEKASNRLNFPFDELVYRDLVTLNIRDEDIVGSNREKCKCSRDAESTYLKDAEPVLSEFYQPQYGEEYSSVTYPLPSSIDKVRRFNGLAIYNKMHFWE